MAPLSRFFEQRIFGEGRALFPAQEAGEPTVNDGLAERQATLITEIANLPQRQTKLIAELEQCEPSGDDDFDRAWRPASKIDSGASWPSRRPGGAN